MVLAMKKVTNAEIRRVMGELGRRTSEKKAAAARENAKKPRPNRRKQTLIYSKKA